MNEDVFFQQRYVKFIGSSYVCNRLEQWNSHFFDDKIHPWDFKQYHLSISADRESDVLDT